MTTLYRPVTIETAEQAEALPVGTVARSHGSDGEPTHACLRVANGWWCTDETNDDGTPFLVPHVGMVRDTALVPIEAGEEWALIYDGQPTLCADEVDAREWSRIDGEGQAPSHRYTTTWEEA